MADAKKKIIYLEADEILQSGMQGYLQKQWGDRYEIVHAKFGGELMRFLSETPKDQIAAVMLGEDMGGLMNVKATIDIIRDEVGNMPIIISNLHFLEGTPVGVYPMKMREGMISDITATIERALNPPMIKRLDGEEPDKGRKGFGER